jgi:regulator of protease activity HflC (stomatin/prohibitin superfamily)
MDNVLFLWMATAAFASYLLLNLMLRRQAKLTDLLREYVKVQREWAQKRAKAAQMARSAARNKAKQEKELADMLAESNVDDPDSQEGFSSNPSASLAAPLATPSPVARTSSPTGQSLISSGP